MDPPLQNSTGDFPSTHWSWIVAAREAVSPHGRDALARFCSAYWYPIYGLIRRRGYSPSDAADLTQEYFARLIQSGLFLAADRDRGKFRMFLRTDCRFFLSDESDRRRTRKRGGHLQVLSIDRVSTERRFNREIADGASPDRLFDRAWSLNLLERAYAALARDEVAAGRGRAFDLLKGALTNDGLDAPYATVAEQLQLTVVAVQSAAARLRRRYAEALRGEVAATLENPTEAEIDDEIRSLFITLAP